MDDIEESSSISEVNDREEALLLPVEADVALLEEALWEEALLLLLLYSDMPGHCTWIGADMTIERPNQHS